MIRIYNTPKGVMGHSHRMKGGLYGDSYRLFYRMKFSSLQMPFWSNRVRVMDCVRFPLFSGLGTFRYGRST